MQSKVLFLLFFSEIKCVKGFSFKGITLQPKNWLVTRTGKSSAEGSHNLEIWQESLPISQTKPNQTLQTKPNQTKIEKKTKSRERDKQAQAL